MKTLNYCMLASSFGTVNSHHISDAGAFGQQEQTPAVDIEYFLYGGTPEFLGHRAFLPTGSVSPMALVRSVASEWARSLHSKIGFALLNLKHKPSVIVKKMNAELHSPFLPSVESFDNAQVSQSGYSNNFPPYIEFTPQDHSLVEAGIFEYLDSFLPKSPNSYSVYAECVPGGTTTAALALSLCAGEVLTTPSSSNDASVHAEKHKIVHLSYHEVKEDFDRNLARGRCEQALSLCCDDFQFHLTLWLARIAMEARELEGSKIILGGGSQMLSVMALTRAVLGKYSDEWKWVTDNVVVVTTSWLYASMEKNGSLAKLSFLDQVTFTHPEFDFSNSSMASLKKYDEGFTMEGCGAGAVLYAAKKGLSLSNQELTSIIESSVSRLLPQAVG